MATGVALSQWRKQEVSVPAGATVDVPYGAFSSFAGVKYIVKAFSFAQDRFNQYELVGTKKLTEVNDQLTSNIANTLKIELNILRDGTEVYLRIVNNELFDIDTSILQTT